MELSILLMEQIAKLFLMIFMGYAVVKLGLLTDEDSKVLSTLVLYLIVPSVILNAFQVDYTQEKVNGLKLAGIASLLLLIILLLIVNLIGKLLNLNEVEIMSIYYSNSGNLIVPIVTFMLGEKWVFYACVFMGLQTIFFWTHCKNVLSHEKEFNPKKLFKTVYNKALNRYCVQHNCSVDIMLEEKSELDRLNKLLDELKKKEQVDYFVE